MKQAKLSVSRAAFAVIIYVLLVNLLSVLATGFLNLKLEGRFDVRYMPEISYELSCGVELVLVAISLIVAALVTLRGQPVWEFSRPRRPASLYALPIFFVVFFVTLMLNTALTSLTERVGFAWPSAVLTPDWGNAVSVLIVAVRFVLAPAVLEELLFRGAILGALAPCGERAACFISAALFTLMHSNPAVWPGIFLLGYLFGYVTLKSGSVIPAIIMHFLNNGIAFLSEYLAAEKGEASVAYLMYALGVASFIGAWLCVSLIATPASRRRVALTKGEYHTPRLLVNLPLFAVVAYSIYLVIVTATKI